MTFVRGAIDWIRHITGIAPAPFWKHDRPGPFLVIGHRGAPAEEPENTIASFQRAIDMGANALELDLCITSDNQLIVWHDWDPDEKLARLRELGAEPDVAWVPCPPSELPHRRPVCDLTFDEVLNNFCYVQKDNPEEVRRECIPRFEEFFDWCCTTPGLRAIFLDVKIPMECIEKVGAFAERLSSIFGTTKPDFRTIIESASPKVIDALRKALPGFEFTLDVESSVGFVLRPKRFSAVRKAIRRKLTVSTSGRPRVVTLAPWMTYRRIVMNDIRLINKRLKKGEWVPDLVLYTVDDDKELDFLVSAGVDGVQSNYPERLRAVAERVHRNIA